MKWYDDIIQSPRYRTWLRALQSPGARVLAALLAVASLIWVVGWLAAWLSILVIGMLVALALMARRLKELTESMADVAETVMQIHDRLEHTDERNRAQVEEEMVRAIDLASIGTGDPSRLAAARLDRDVFPRLTTLMDIQPPAETIDPSKQHSQMRPDDADRDWETELGGVVQKDLLRTWKIGLRNRDIESCRTVYAALVDTVDGAVLAPLKTKLQELADHTEHKLRESFAASRDRGDVRGMIQVGQQICRLLPDRPIAEEFRSAEPHLQRLANPHATYPPPALRIHH